MTAEIAARFHAMRRALGLTADEMAEAIGVHVIILYNYEQGEHPPSPNILARLQEVYGVDPDYIMLGTVPAQDGASQ